MQIKYDGSNNMADMYSNYSDSDNTKSVGYNGLTGFKNWECYMIVKYGHNGDFSFHSDDNNNGKDQYLLELPLYPDQVTESISASWSTQNVLGRSSPVSAYANTDLKTVNFSLDLHRDLMTGMYSLTDANLKNLHNGDKNYLKYQAAGKQMQSSGGPFGTRTWYVNANKMLQISCYPQYTSKGLIPPITYFVFGQMILKGYVTNYQTEWKKPIINTFYGWNSVSISMQCYPDTIISASDIITNEKTGTASTQNTYNTVFPTWDAKSSNVMTRTLTNSRSNARTSTSLGDNPMDVD